MNRERLERVCVVLENVPKVRFDLDAWQSCGTVFCAVGWACQDPIFNKEGLHASRLTPAPDRSGGAPMFEHYLGWPAVEQFFDLTESEAQQLFAQWGYSIMAGKPGPAEVIAKVRAFIARGEDG